MRTRTRFTRRIQAIPSSLRLGPLPDCLCKRTRGPSGHLRLLLLLLFAALLIQPCLANSSQPEAIDALTFTDSSEASGLFENNLSWGAAWGDYDGDGNIDVFTVGHLGGICQLWHNNGDGTFTDVTTAAGMLTDDGDAHGPCWADLDNDGNLDLYVAKGTLKEGEPQNYSDLWRNNGNGTFTDIAVESGVTGIDHRSRGCYAIDYNNDGDLDLFIPSFFKADAGEPSLLFRNDGDFQFTDVATRAGVGRADMGSWSAAWSDYDLDGLVDVFVTTGPNRSGASMSALYRNNGDGTFTDVTSAAEITVALSNCAAWADFDNDGYPDLYIGLNGATILYRNNGDGTFSDVTRRSGVFNMSRALAIDWGDYDNDGNLDLYVVNDTTSNRLFRNNGDGTFTDVAASLGVTAKQGGGGSDGTFIDYNNDGFLDLFVCNGAGPQPGPYLLFENTGNRNHWLNIVLIGTASNRDGTGAKIRLTAGKGTLYQQYFGQHSVAQNRIPVHFGLRGATLAKSLIIDWPSGTHQELDNIAADRTLTITEP